MTTETSGSKDLASVFKKKKGISFVFFHPYNFSKGHVAPKSYRQIQIKFTLQNKE